MKLSDFLTMWGNDGIQLNQLREVNKDGHLWLLYSVIFPQSTYDYGRHTGLIIVVDKSTLDVVAHDINNDYGETGNRYYDVESWFEKHVEVGLKDVSQEGSP